MPKVMIWVRVKDYDDWLAIENKPTVIHDMIQAHKATTPLDKEPAYVPTEDIA